MDSRFRECRHFLSSTLDRTHAHPQLLPAQLCGKQRAPFANELRAEWPEHAAALRWNMRDRSFDVAEYVVVEQLRPCGPLLGRQAAQRDQRVGQAIESGVVGVRRAPPVVD